MFAEVQPMKQLVILGAGCAGTMMVNRLSKRLSKDWKITIIDRDRVHLYQPGLLLLPFGQYSPEELVRDRKLFLPTGVELRTDAVERIDPEAKTLSFAGGSSLQYDLLIVATGTRTAPELVEGLTDEGWMKSAFDFYTLDGAVGLGRALEDMRSGRIVINVTDMPIKCPVAPLELAFLMDAFFEKRGLRENVELVYATPLDGAFTKPRASAMLGHLLEKKNILVEADFALERVNGEKGAVHSYDGRALEYDLLVNVPLHQGEALLNRSGLGDDAGFVPTEDTLRSKEHEDIFVLGDATDLPASKAGSVAHFQSEVLTENIIDTIEGRAPSTVFDGHSNCFIETGHDKAMLIDFNYTTEPLPGKFPLPGIGPFSLLLESHVNHWGKLAFKWVYWNQLLPGKELPLDHRMTMAGKWR